MHLLTRSQWGAKPPRHPLVAVSSTRGVKIHYEGVKVPAELDHSSCDDVVRAIQAAHLADEKENYSDIAYNYVVCRHGSVYEGRGLHHLTGANGNHELNVAHYSVCALLGSEGLTHPPDAMLTGLRDVVDYLRKHGSAGDEIKGHKDGYATDCPGDPLYSWVQAGAHRPAGDTGETKTPPPAPSFPGRQYFLLGATNAHAKLLQRWLDKGKWGPAYKVGPSEHMTQLDLQKVAALQHHFVQALGPADGLCGPLTWRYAYEVAAGLRDR